MSNTQYIYKIMQRENQEDGMEISKEYIIRKMTRMSAEVE